MPAYRSVLLLALVVGSLVVATLVASASVSLAAADPASLAERGQAAPTPIDACTVIDAPGHYRLAGDVDATADAGPCLVIAASDVVLDGDGHRVQGRVIAVPESTERFVPVGLAVAESDDLANVTVRDLTVDTARVSVGDFGSELGVDGLRFEGVAVGTEGAGERVGLSVSSSSRVALVDVRVSGFEYALGVARSSDVLVRNGTFADAPAVAVDLTAVTNGTLVDSTLFQRVDVEDSTDVAIVGNDAGAEFVSVRLLGSSALVAENRLTGVTVGPSLGSAPWSVVVRDNVLTSPAVSEYVRPGSTILLDEGVDASTVEVHGNVLNATGYGVQNDGLGRVDARGNYWGDPSGPSSPDGGPVLVDPVTGARADGEGSAVSADPEDPGTANVCFDPAREEPTNASRTTG